MDLGAFVNRLWREWVNSAYVVKLIVNSDVDEAVGSFRRFPVNGEVSMKAEKPSVFNALVS